MKYLIIIMLSILLVACHSGSPSQEIDAQNQSDMETNRMEENKQRVRDFFQLLEDENIAEFVNQFAENGRQVNPYASGIFPDGAKGHEELLKYWEPVPGNFDGMEFIIEDLLGTEDSNRVFVKYTGRIKLKNGAGYYENQYYSTFTFNEEGKILEYVEIFNPIVAAKAFHLNIQ